MSLLLLCQVFNEGDQEHNGPSSSQCDSCALCCASDCSSDISPSHLGSFSSPSSGGLSSASCPRWCQSLCLLIHPLQLKTCQWLWQVFCIRGHLQGTLLSCCRFTILPSSSGNLYTLVFLFFLANVYRLTEVQYTHQPGLTLSVQRTLLSRSHLAVSSWYCKFYPSLAGQRVWYGDY